MKKLLLARHVIITLIVILIMVGLEHQIKAQSQEFKFSYCNTSFSVLKETAINGQIVTDTLCTEGIIRNHNTPMAFCQNDSMFFVLSQLYFADCMNYELCVYRKDPPCKYERMITFKETRGVIIRKTLIKSVNNRIIIEFNDNGKIFIIAEYDPYKTTLESFMQQFITNSKKI